MKQTDNSGHRQRLRDKTLAGKPEAFSDEALLELLLTYALPRLDVQSLAKELLEKYGSLVAVLSAPPMDLAQFKGIKESVLALFKAVDRIRVQAPSIGQQSSARQLEIAAPAREKVAWPEKMPAPVQQELPEEIIEVTDKPPAPEPEPTKGKKKRAAKSRAVSRRQPKKITVPSIIVSKGGKRKFQVCNGYLLEFDQLARVLHSLQEMRTQSKISREDLMESTGLADRQLESLVSVGAAMGLIVRGRQKLTVFGEVIAEHDIFLELRPTLEWCHYAGAASSGNLVWYDIFNVVVVEKPLSTQEVWKDFLRRRLEEHYTPRTVGKHLNEEVRFVLDAYQNRNFRKLELLNQTHDDKLYRRRYTDFEPLIVCAMLYDYGLARNTRLLQVEDVAATPGSPAMVFGVDVAALRQLVEGLHQRGWVRYETTHGLDQIRLKPSFSALEMLRAFYEDRDPKEDEDAGKGDLDS
ncbi:MAG: DUF4007 family protein [Candidatus Hydrogenedentes bacterium]|nr:DUF4007 family protein [Candidatus Hydrogenedentota bacterium]